MTSSDTEVRDFTKIINHKIQIVDLNEKEIVTSKGSKKIKYKPRTYTKKGERTKVWATRKGRIRMLQVMWDIHLQKRPRKPSRGM